MGKHRWTLYVLECAGGRLYTGITTNLETRYAAHCAGRGAKFTRSFPPSCILHSETYPDRASASRAEAAFKRLSATEKRRAVGAATGDRA